MPRLVFQPGLVTDDPRLSTPGRFASGNNVRFRGGRPETIGLHRKVLDASGNPVAVAGGKARGMATYMLHAPQGDKARFVMAIGTTQNLYVGDTSTTGNNEAQWSFSSVLSCTGASPREYSSRQIVRRFETSYLLATVWSIRKGKNSIFCMPSGHNAGALVTLSAGSPSIQLFSGVPKCNSAFITDDNFAVYLGIHNASTVATLPSQPVRDAMTPMTVLWTDQDAYTDFTITDTSLAGFYDLNDGNMVVGGGASSRGNLVWTDTALYQMKPLYDAEFVFGFEKVDRACGLCGPNAWAEADGRVFWISQQRTFHVFDGGTVHEIPCTVRADTLDVIDWTQAWQIHGRADPDNAAVRWYLPRNQLAEPSNLEIDGYVEYNYETGEWSLGDITRTCATGIDTGPLDFAVGTDGYLYEHNLKPEAARVESLDWSLSTTPFDISFISDKQPAYENSFSLSRVVQDRTVDPPESREAAFTLSVYARSWPAPATEQPRVQRQTIHPETGEVGFHLEGHQLRLEWAGSGRVFHRFGDTFAWVQLGGER